MTTFRVSNLRFRLSGLVMGVLVAAALSAQTPVRTMTPLPKLSGGFGRPQATVLPAPTTDPDGGLIDSGPPSFDTKWYDWSGYASQMIRRIKLHWDVPELARLGWKGSLTVRFHILADGQVADARIVRPSEILPFDNAALQAILKSSPFQPLPQDLHEEREGITITFFYNMRPESGAGSAENLIPTPILRRASVTTPRAIRTAPPITGLSVAVEKAAAELETDRDRTGRGFSLDQSDFKYPIYVEKLVQIISMNWFRPAQTVQTSPVVHFQIERDGTITRPRIVTSSGLPFVDRAALRAVIASSPLPPLPAEYGGPHLGIQVVFE